MTLSSIKTIDTGNSWIYLLSWPPDASPEEIQEAFVVPVIARQRGVILAVPLNFISQELLAKGATAGGSDLIGPSIQIRAPAVQESDTAEEVLIGNHIPCLLVDFSELVVPLLREFDPVTDGHPIQHFLPELPETFPLSNSLLEQALEWITNETSSRVHYYSAVEEEDEVQEVPVTPRPGARRNPKAEAAKPKKVTTAVLADQLAALTDTLPAITTQLNALRENQERLEGALVQVRDTPRPAAHQQEFPVPPLPQGNALGDFMKTIGAAPRVKTATPLRQQVGPIILEDEPVLQPDQDGYRPAGNANMGQLGSGSTAQALVQQSQAMTALVAHLINQDAGGDLSSLGHSGLSSKGTAKREKLQQELQNRSGGFMLSVAQTVHRRMRPTDVVPTSLAALKGRSLFTRYFEKQGGYQGQRDLAMVQWMMAHISDALLNEDVKGAQELCALSLVTIDQAVQDSGRWDVAYVLSLMEEPPPGMMVSRGKPSNPRLTAFSPICPQPWATTALAFIKEMDLISVRRSEAAGGPRKTGKSEEETERPNPKRKPRFPKKPKQGET